MIDSQAVSVLGNSPPDADKKHDSKASHQALSSLDIDATTEEGVMTSLQQKDSTQLDENSQESDYISIGGQIRDFCIQHIFLLTMITAILVAYAAPFIGKKGGPIASEYSISYGINCLIFLISGISLKTKSLFQALIGRPGLSSHAISPFVFVYLLF
jgi:hypothetical protein